ncbi:MAG: hypothetical protein ACFFC7_28140 [Candidatus Hermodarchaeota archaeon]
MEACQPTWVLLSVLGYYSRKNILSRDLHHNSNQKKGYDIEVGFPVTRRIETDDIKCRTLEAIEVMSIVYKGQFNNDKRRQRNNELYSFLQTHGIPVAAPREVYHDSNNPLGNEIELQVALHDWSGLLTRNLDRVLGVKRMEEVMKGFDRLSLESSAEERGLWVKTVCERLDRLAEEDQKYEILSCCAHEFPKRLIEDMRVIYERTKNVDAVLKAMEGFPDWYESPFREGNIIYTKKIMANKQGYNEAKSNAEKKMQYCHCYFIKTNLDKGIPATFCYCGAGWYRQLWEGILQKPLIKIETLKSILKGDDECLFAIHLPSQL